MPVRAASAAWKPILLWVPSQNGLVTDAPHRHSANLGPRPLVSILLPSTSTNSTSPSTRYGPLGRMLILTAMRHLHTRVRIRHIIARPGFPGAVSSASSHGRESMPAVSPQPLRSSRRQACRSSSVSKYRPDVSEVSRRVASPFVAGRGPIFDRWKPFGVGIGDLRSRAPARAPRAPETTS